MIPQDLSTLREYVAEYVTAVGNGRVAYATQIARTFMRCEAADLIAEVERLRARLDELTAPAATAILQPDDESLPVEPDESEYAVATDKTWLDAVTGDDSGEVVHEITAPQRNNSGWYWGCRCGDGGIELAAREYAQIEARDHLDGVNARVFTAKPPFYLGCANGCTDEDQVSYCSTHGLPSAEAGILDESGTAAA